jgi:hypothetical protein
MFLLRKPPIRKYASARWEILEPIVTHAVDAIGIGIVVHATSLGLQFILSEDMDGAVHQLEILFYVLLSGSLALYTFIYFCMILAVQLTEAGRGMAYRLENDTEPQGLGGRNRAVDALPPAKDVIADLSVGTTQEQKETV